MRGHGGLAVCRGNVLVAGLGPLERPVLEGERGDDLMPFLRDLGFLEVVGEEELLLLGDGLLRDGGLVVGEDGRGDEEEGRERESQVHGSSLVRVWMTNTGREAAVPANRFGRRQFPPGPSRL